MRVWGVLVLNNFICEKYCLVCVKEKSKKKRGAQRF